MSPAAMTAAKVTEGAIRKTKDDVVLITSPFFMSLMKSRNGCRIDGPCRPAQKRLDAVDEPQE